MKKRTEKIGVFSFKMNFGLDAGACRKVGASHSLCFNELFHRSGSVSQARRSVISGLLVSSAASHSTFSTAIKADDLAGRVSAHPVHHGASGIATVMNCCFKSIDVTPIMMAWNVLKTFFLSCAARLLKVIMRKSTMFLISCQARLFVYSIAGYFRKTKISPLNVIRRLRILSASRCDRGCWLQSFLNLLLILFRAERYSSAVNAEHWL